MVYLFFKMRYNDGLYLHHLIILHPVTFFKDVIFANMQVVRRVTAPEHF
jgi:hypothetical protein